jgi:hypothetical protein
MTTDELREFYGEHGWTLAATRHERRTRAAEQAARFRADARPAPSDMPSGVRFVSEDGTRRIELEVAFAGWGDEDGLAIWEATALLPPFEAGVLEVDRLPARCRVVLKVRAE